MLFGLGKMKIMYTWTGWVILRSVDPAMIRAASSMYSLDAFGVNILLRPILGRPIATGFPGMVPHTSLSHASSPGFLMTAPPARSSP